MAGTRAGVRRSRRTALRLVALGALAGAASPLACSGTSGRSAGAGTPAAKARGSPVATVPAEAIGKAGGKLVLAAAAVPAGYDPVTQATASLSGFLSLACNGLLAPRNGTARFPDPADIALVPDLAAAAPEQPEAVVYVFRLRSGLAWQQVAPVNGRTLTAADVKRHFDRALGDPRSVLKPAFAPIQAVDTPDELTVRFTLKEPYAPFLSLVVGGADRFIVPHELSEPGRPRGVLAGSGPFVLQPPQGGRSTFRRNLAYFKRDTSGAPLPYAETVDWLVLPDAAGRLQALQSRQASVSAPLSADEADQLRASNANDFSFQDAAGVSNYLYMRLDRPPFDDKRLRQAISLALDRAAMLQALAKGRGAVDLPIPVLLGDLSSPLTALGEAGRFYARDLQAARQLLTAAGHGDGLSTMLSYSPAYGTGFVQAVALLRGFLREAGIAVTPVELDYARYLATVFKGNFDGLAYGGRGTFPDPEPYLGYFYTPGGIYYQDGANDATLQALIAGQRRELDRRARIAVLLEIQRYLSDAQYRVYDVAVARTFAWQKSLRNYRGSEWSSYAQCERAWLEK